MSAATPPATALPSRTVLVRAVRAELVKALTVGSTAWALAVAAVLVVLVGVVMSLALVADPGGTAGEPVTDPRDAALNGVSAALYAVAVFGVLAVTGEYSTRTVRSSLAAVPRRGVLVTAKAIAVAGLTAAVALPAALVTVLGSRLLLAGTDVPVPEPATALRMALGATAYLAVVALIGSGLGWLLRSTAGALGALVGMLVLVPAVAQLLPGSAGELVRGLLPDAGPAAYLAVPPVPPWVGLAVVSGYAIALLAAGRAAVDRREP